jgi:hypothetical protein
MPDPRKEGTFMRRVLFAAALLPLLLVASCSDDATGPGL